MSDAFPATDISEAGDVFHETIPYSDDCVRLFHNDRRSSSHSELMKNSSWSLHGSIMWRGYSDAND
jgi:hypothetical protein